MSNTKDQENDDFSTMARRQGEMKERGFTISSRRPRKDKESYWGYDDEGFSQGNDEIA